MKRLCSPMGGELIELINDAGNSGGDAPARLCSTSERTLSVNPSCYTFIHILCTPSLPYIYTDVHVYIHHIYT